MEQKKKSKKRRVLQVFLLMISSMILFVSYATYDIWSYRFKTDKVDTDLCCCTWSIAWNGKPSPVFRERINHAISLYQNGNIKKIIFTGGTKFEAELEEARTAKAYALKRNVKDEDILIETKSRFTEDNLKNAKQVGMEHGLQTYTIVSDPLHMKRAMQIAKHIGMDAYASPTPTSAYKSLDTEIPFFFKELCSYIGYMTSLPIRALKGE
ncbi:YdcF family protein [Bacillus cytotoxicus]